MTSKNTFAALAAAWDSNVQLDGYFRTMLINSVVNQDDSQPECTCYDAETFGHHWNCEKEQS